MEEVKKLLAEAYEFTASMANATSLSEKGVVANINHASAYANITQQIKNAYEKLLETEENNNKKEKGEARTEIVEE